MAAVGTTSTSQDLSRLRAIATRPRIALRLVAVFLRESSRRPVRLRRVAAAGAMERSDVLERHEDVPVELDVGDIVDVAVRGEDAVLVLAAEERDLDLLAFVLVRVVLDGLEPSRKPNRYAPAHAVAAVKRVPGVVPVWSAAAKPQSSPV